jgi:hypothetical protein
MDGHFQSLDGALFVHAHFPLGNSFTAFRRHNHIVVTGERQPARLLELSSRNCGKGKRRNALS